MSATFFIFTRTTLRATTTDSNDRLLSPTSRIAAASEMSGTSRQRRIVSIEEYGPFKQQRKSAEGRIILAKEA